MEGKLPITGSLSLKTTFRGGQPRQGDSKPGGVAAFWTAARPSRAIRLV